jgi:ribose transport system permease protein
VSGTRAAETSASLEGAEVPVEPAESLFGRFTRSTAIVTFLALCTMIIGFSLKAPGQFDTWSNFRQLAQNVAILTVVSVGTTFVIATAGVDLSIPSGIVLGEVFAVKALGLIHVPGVGTAVDVAGTDSKATYILAALGGSLAAGLALGIVNGIAVGYMRIPPLLATLGTLGAGLGIALLVQNGVNTASNALDPISTGHVIPGVPNLITIAAIVVLLGVVLLNFSVFGRHTLAIGSNAEAARRVGIKVERHLLKVYVLGGVASGFAGFLSLSYFTTTSLAGHSTDNLKAITAVALGGTSLFGGVATIIGTLVGVWIPAVLQNGFVIIGVQPYWQDVVVGFVLILTVWADQLRRRARQR